MLGEKLREHLAGEATPRNPLGAYMVQVATRALQDADVVLFIVDVSTPPGPGDERLAEILAQRSEPGRARAKGARSNWAVIGRNR